MSERWTGWKSFPDHYFGEYIQASMGPGLYEVCRSATREQVAFGCTRNVADALCDFLQPRGLRKWLFLRRRRHYDTGELEYRIWPTATFADAKAASSLIRDRQKALMRKYAPVRVLKPKQN